MTTETFTVRVSDAAGNETVGTKTFGVGEAVIPIVGDFSGTIEQGEHGHITGNVNLTGDLIVEGLLTGIDTFTLEGNRFQLLFQNGGRPLLAGVEKSGWVRRGETPVGWQTADRLVIAPTSERYDTQGKRLAADFLPTEGLWTGNWETMVFPSHSADVTLPVNPWGDIAVPEIVNLSQTIVLKNLRRIHFHDGAGVATLKWLKVLNSGTSGVLADYPLHFHLCGETVRGSLVEGVVVEGGRNHAFVPHGSHGITFRDTAAYNTINDAYWWDSPPTPGSTVNASNDILYDHTLVCWVKKVPGDSGIRLAGFLLGAGSGNGVINSVATCVQGSTQSAGFLWSEHDNNNPAGVVWDFHHNIAHNNLINGTFVWQNDFHPHVVEDFVGYRNGQVQIDHGAYGNVYKYRRCVLMGGLFSFKLHAVNALLLEDIIGDKRLYVTKHANSAVNFATVRRCRFSSVIYNEFNDGGFRQSKIRYEDRGWTPADFAMGAAVLTSIAEIYEGGVLIHRWTQGAWI